MELRSRAKRQQQEKTKQSAAQPNAGLDILPGEIMSMLAARFLCQEDVAAASMTCQSWARVLRAGISRAALVVGDGHVPGPGFTLKAMGKHTSVSDMQLLLNSRSFHHLKDTISSLEQLPLLKHLQLTFLMSNTPKKGNWPATFADSLETQQVESISVQSPAMPASTLMSLLANLGRVWGSRRAAGCTHTLQHLDLRLGQPAPGSQLPVFANPSWLMAGADSSSRRSGLVGDNLWLLAEITSLASLRCEVSSTVLPSKLGLLSSLTNLTELVLHGTSALSSGHVQQLPQLRSLRKLGFTMDATKPSLRPLEHLPLDFVQELELGVVCDANGESLQPLLARPPAGLRGLTVSGLCLQQSFVEQLVGLTGLTSLQLVNAVDGCSFLDLSAWRHLSGLRQLTLQVSKPMPLVQLRFEGTPMPKPQRVLRGSCQSVGKRRKSAAQQQIEQRLQQQQQQLNSMLEKRRPNWGDISALASAWPQLQALKLSGMSPYAVGRTCWEALSTLTALTSLALQFIPASPLHNALTQSHQGVHHVAGEPSRETVVSLGEALPVLRLEHLPAGVQELQLANCYVGVPDTGCVRAGDTLRTISLSKCYMGSIEKGASTRKGKPIIIQDASLAFVSTRASDISQTHPLLLLLQRTPQLQMLELINLPWLTDALLSSAAAQVQLRALSSLSVIGIGNQHLTHGALLGLTSLRKLRELRWHVGSVLELMPDVNALAQLQGLMTVHVPHWLHSQMERWGAYAVLDSMPLCDVNVELP